MYFLWNCKVLLWNNYHVVFLFQEAAFPEGLCHWLLINLFCVLQISCRLESRYVFPLKLCQFRKMSYNSDNWTYFDAFNFRLSTVSEIYLSIHFIKRNKPIAFKYRSQTWQFVKILNITASAVGICYKKNK